MCLHVIFFKSPTHLTGRKRLNRRLWFWIWNIFLKCAAWNCLVIKVKSAAVASLSVVMYTYVAGGWLYWGILLTTPGEPVPTCSDDAHLKDFTAAFPPRILRWGRLWQFHPCYAMPQPTKWGMNWTDPVWTTVLCLQAGNTYHQCELTWISSILVYFLWSCFTADKQLDFQQVATFKSVITQTSPSNLTQRLCLLSHTCYLWNGTQGNNIDVSQSADDLACCKALARKHHKDFLPLIMGLVGGSWMKRRARPAWQGETCQLYTGKIYMFRGSGSKINTAIKRTEVSIELDWFSEGKNPTLHWMTFTSM